MSQSRNKSLPRRSHAAPVLRLRAGRIAAFFAVFAALCAEGGGAAEGLWEQPAKLTERNTSLDPREAKSDTAKLTERNTSLDSREAELRQHVASAAGGAGLSDDVQRSLAALVALSSATAAAATEEVRRDLGGDAAHTDGLAAALAKGQPPVRYSSAPRRTHMQHVYAHPDGSWERAAGPSGSFAQEGEVAGHGAGERHRTLKEQNTAAGGASGSASGPPEAGVPPRVSGDGPSLVRSESRRRPPPELDLDMKRLMQLAIAVLVPAVFLVVGINTAAYCEQARARTAAEVLTEKRLAEHTLAQQKLSEQKAAVNGLRKP